FKLKLRRQYSDDSAVVILVKVIARLGILHHEVIFQKLIEHFKQLAAGLNATLNVPTAQVINVRRAGGQLRVGRHRIGCAGDPASGESNGQTAELIVGTGEKPITQGVGPAVRQSGDRLPARTEVRGDRLEGQILGDCFRRNLFIDISLGPDRSNALEFVRGCSVGQTVQNRAGEQTIGGLRRAARVHWHDLKSVKGVW